MIKDTIAQLLQAAIKETGVTDFKLNLEHPANMEFGDYTTNVALQMSKPLKKNPMDIASEVISHLPQNEYIEKAEAVKPGFINIWIKNKYLHKNLELMATSNNIGLSEINKDKKVIIEYSSPNIAKPFTVGHLRSTIIGDAVANLLQATGYRVFRDNHLGDWGTQFGKQIYAIKTWGNEEEIENAERPVKVLVDLYVKFHTEAENNPDLEDEARKWFKKLEDNDAEAKRLWKKCIDWSWKEFDAIYEKMNVKFTENNGRGYGESFFEDKMKPVINELEQKELLKESEGAQLVFFAEDKYPPLMIIKKDGSTLYGTRDLATDKFRLEHYGKDIKVINEVGAEQSLYFQQLFEIEQLLGWYTKDQRVHVRHGHYRFKDQKMSTRKGNVIWLEDVLEEAEKRAALLNKNGNSNNLSGISMGAIKWNDLKRESIQDIVFDWDDILNMQGNSGPYMQYTYVRCLSVLEKGTIAENINYRHVKQEELELIRLLHKFPEIVIKAAEMYAPHIVATYLFEVAQKFNLFYQKYPILKSAEEIKQFRLALTKATANVIKEGLGLLGILTVEKM